MTEINDIAINMDTQVESDSKKESDTQVDSDSKKESDSRQMCEDRTWLVKQACQRIKEMYLKKLEKILSLDKEEPDEIEFDWVDVKKDLLNFCGIIVDGKYNREATPMQYSLDTIFNGGFTTGKGKVKRGRLREAGVKNPFVLDVKRAMAKKCVKVWDISNKKISNKSVWRITVFFHEIRKIKKESTET